MPAWVAKEDKLRMRIKEEEERAERLRLAEHEKWRQWRPRVPAMSEIPPMGELVTPTFEQPIVEENLVAPSSYIQQVEYPSAFQPPEETWTPETYRRPIMRQPITPVIAPEAPKTVKEAPPTKKPSEPIIVPFWQRALQVFAAPFQWIDENIIKPGESLLGTTLGFVPEVERKPGEDFWEWKKRSWAGWETPGIDINVPWSDEPLRLDVRGITELAPWLLIPGAGQVGGGLRAARGVAGILGKLGTAGRVLGTAVEYSPWGLVEKTAGVAIKGGFRAVGAVSERISTAVGEKLFGKYVPPPMPPEVTKLTAHFKETVMPSYRAFRKEVPALRARQEAAVQDVLRRDREGKIPLERLQAELDIARTGGIKPEYALTPEALAARQAKAIAEVEARVVSGELTESVGKALITKLRKSPAYTVRPFEVEEVRKLQQMMNDAFQNGLVEAESKEAFMDLMFGQLKTLPAEHNLIQWKAVFGDDFAKAVGSLGSPSRANQVIEALGIPKSMVAMMDMSGFGRQGLFFVLLHPTKIPTWFIKYGKSFLSEKLTLDMDDALRARPIAKIFQQGKTPGYLRPVREAPLALREEAYPAMANRIPFLRRSGRSFNAGLNEMALDTFEAGYNAMKAQGAAEAQIDLWRGFINIASGRGTLPKGLEKYAPALNLVLFSPRLQAATLQLPRQLGRMFLSGNPYMRKEAAKVLGTFAVGGSALLGLLNATGVAKVAGDPRSGDFGKIRFREGTDVRGQPKYSETRIDIWRGYIQYARFAAQLLSGERLSAYGNMNKAERGEIAGRFIQSKMSPVAGIFSDIWRGENYKGEPLFNDTTGFSKTARERFLPLAVQDLIDAMEMNGVNGALTASPAFLGVGALTYVNDFVKVKEKIAGELGYDSWDDIDPKTQREIQNRNAELQAATIAFDRQVMGTAWGDWRLAGNAVDDTFKENVQLAVNQYRQTGDGYTFRGKVTDAFTARRGGFAAREKMPRFEDIVKRLDVQDTAEAWVGLGPEQLAIKTYNDALYGDDMYDEFGDYRFDEARNRKVQLSQSLGDEMFNYVEEYQGLKYDALPEEFKELQKAKEIMKPYWEVANRVEQLFGKQFAESSRGQAFIAKQKKLLRLSNPTIARYYDMFYKQV